MRRRSRASGKLSKARSRKAMPKRRNATTVRRRRSSAETQETKFVRLARERDEALEQQKAAAEVLKIISTSPTELQPVLDVVVRSAARFCDADDVTIFELDGHALRTAAHWGTVPQEIGACFPCTRGSVAGRTVIDRKPVHVIDLQAEAEEFPEGYAFARRLGHRTTAGVPLLREGVAIGTIQLRRTEVNPFTDKQLALLGTFAAQAVIAIENARLLNELRQRTTDLTESLEQQTATSEILTSMSGSMTETKPVFDAILRNLLRLFGTSYAVVQLLQDGMIQLVAFDGEPGFERLPSHYPLPLDDSTVTGCAMLAKQVLQVAPLIDNPTTPPASARFAREYGHNAMLSAPMIRGGNVIGAIATARRDPRAFDDKQLTLIKSFADQAVIAIENARLLNELRQRTSDLTESLDQQTATSEVLETISSSPGDLRPVFGAILESAVRLCGATKAMASAPRRCTTRHLLTPSSARGSCTPVQILLCGRRYKPSSRRRSRTLQSRKGMSAIHGRSPQSRWEVTKACLAYRCCTKISRSGPLPFFVRRRGSFRISKLNYSRALRNRRSSPSRTRGYSMSCENRFSSRPQQRMCCA
jgi:GAF domain-containing protein